MNYSFGDDHLSENITEINLNQSFGFIIYKSASEKTIELLKPLFFVLVLLIIITIIYEKWKKEG